jgi:hypothetical protein
MLSGALLVAAIPFPGQLRLGTGHTYPILDLLRPQRALEPTNEVLWGLLAKILGCIRLFLEAVPRRNGIMVIGLVRLRRAIVPRELADIPKWPD